MTVKSKATAKPRPATPPIPQVSNPHGVSPVYANNLGLSATLTDFTLLFTQTGQWPAPDETLLHNELVAAVTLPPLAAMGLMQALNQYMKTFNENQGALAQAMGIDGNPQQ